jgi:hypothetical protein
MSEDQEFYVGYEPRMPPRLATFVRRRILTILAVAVAGAALFAAGFRVLPPSRFEFGTVRSFEGRLVADPYPQLLTGGPAQVEPYLLAGPGKHGATPFVVGFEGQQVSLRGTLAERDGHRVIEIVPGSLIPAADVAEGTDPARSLGRRTLRGEIVDTKCFLGVMNPGERKVHRDCAVRCILGGIAPALLTRDHEGREALLLLESATGKAVGGAVAPLAGLPVEVDGEILARGGTLRLRADPAAYRKLGW